jgi:hypothetical protein
MYINNLRKRLSPRENKVENVSCVGRYVLCIGARRKQVVACNKELKKVLEESKERDHKNCIIFRITHPRQCPYNYLCNGHPLDVLR